MDKEPASAPLCEQLRRLEHEIATTYRTLGACTGGGIVSSWSSAAGCHARSHAPGAAIDEVSLSRLRAELDAARATLVAVIEMSEAKPGEARARPVTLRSKP